MNVKGKKLCWNCEGEVHMYAMQCPYCAVDLMDAPEPERKESFESPYRLVQPMAEEPRAFAPPVSEEEKPIPQATYQASYTNENLGASDAEWSGEDSAGESVLQNDFKDGIKPLVLLLPGALLFAFSLGLLFFGKHGELVLQWSAGLWPFYLLLSLPLIYFGWKSLPKR